MSDYLNIFQFSWLFGPGLPAIELQKKHVVIIGGGYGGAELAVQLKKSAIPFTLIDPKDYFHHNVAALRAAVYPEWMNKSAIYFKDTFGDSFIQGINKVPEQINTNVLTKRYEGYQYLA